MKNVQIIFDNSSNVVYSGQIAAGKVQLNLKSAKKVKAISITLRGEADVSWFQKDKILLNGNEQTKNVKYTGHEDYFYTNFYLLGSVNSGATELAAGENNFTFSFTVPHVAPSSFEGEKGYVRYIAIVTIDRPWKFNHVIKKSFTVMSPLDLNQCPRLRNPTSVTIHKNFQFCLFKSGHIVVTTSVACTGFVPGDAILFVIRIENTSRRRIKNINYVLLRTVTYHSKWPKKITIKNREKVIEFNVGKSFPPRSTSTINERLLIPQIAPSHLYNCNLMDVIYEIHAKVKFQGFHKPHTAVLPIVIGTVPIVNLEPLSDQNNITTDLNYSQSQQQQSFGWDPSILDSSTAFLLPPPSYDEIHNDMSKPSGSYVQNYPGFKTPSAPEDPTLSNQSTAGPSAPLPFI